MAKSNFFVFVLKLASRMRRRKAVQKVEVSYKQLSNMPVDVILEIFLHLDFADVLSLSLVSRLFYRVSQCLVVWKSLALKLMCRGRRISLHDHLSMSTLTAAQLRQSVLMTTAAEGSWLKASPKHVARPHPLRLQDVDLDHASYIMKFTSRRHLVLPTKSGELVGWDTRTGTCAGIYNMGADSVLINVQGDYMTRSLYWITGKISSDPDHEQNLHILILRIQFPDPSSSQPVAFDALADLVTPCSLAAELHFLDVSQRMICAVFLNEETLTAGLHVVLDWNTGLSYIFDTGIRYDYGRAVIGLHLSGDKQSIILRSEHNGIEVRRVFSLQKMRNRGFIWNAAYRPTSAMSLVRPDAFGLTRWEHEYPGFDNGMVPHTVWVLPQWWPTYPGVPRRMSTIILYLSLIVGRRGQLRRVWRAAQHYSDAVESAEGMKGEVKGRDIDEESDDGESDFDKSEAQGCARELLSGAPCSSARSVVNIGAHAVAISLGLHGLPILAQSFNHLGWIEEGDDDESMSARGLERLRPRSLLSTARRLTSLPRRKRRLKFVTFPDPSTSPIRPNCKLSTPGSRLGRRRRYGRNCSCTTLKPVTLDVPSSVLDRVYHMFLDPAAGTITLATEDNELHVYQYGMPPLPSGPEVENDEGEIKGKAKMTENGNEDEDEGEGEYEDEDGICLSGVGVDVEMGASVCSSNVPVVSV